MTDSNSQFLNPSAKNPVKKVWTLGSKTVVAIDENLVKRLGINEDNTFVEQIIVDGGILLRLQRKLD